MRHPKQCSIYSDRANLPYRCTINPECEQFYTENIQSIQSGYNLRNRNTMYADGAKSTPSLYSLPRRPVYNSTQTVVILPR